MLYLVYYLVLQRDLLLVFVLICRFQKGRPTRDAKYNFKEVVDYVTNIASAWASDGMDHYVSPRFSLCCLITSIIASRMVLAMLVMKR